MGLIKKDISITIHSTISSDNDEHETSTETHNGQYYKKEAMEVLMYTDEANDLGNIKNTITIQPDKVSVKRTGAVQMHQLFIAGQKTECIYRHPYGRFLLEIDTHSIDVVRLENDKTQITIKYDMLLDEKKQFFTITVEVQ